MTTLEVLKAAREKIAKPECWIQHNYARNEKGREVMPFEQDACCYCSAGAILAVTQADGISIGSEQRRQQREQAQRAVSKLNETLRENASPYKTTDTIDFNDLESTTHEKVLELFDKTIQRLEKETAKQ